MKHRRRWIKAKSLTRCLDACKSKHTRTMIIRRSFFGIFHAFLRIFGTFCLSSCRLGPCLGMCRKGASKKWFITSAKPDSQLFDTSRLGAFIASVRRSVHLGFRRFCTRTFDSIIIVHLSSCSHFFVVHGKLLNNSFQPIFHSDPR